MPVSEFLIPSNAANGNFAVLARIAAIFAPHEADPASLAVVIDSGHVRAGNTLIEVAKQLVDGIVAPTTSPRIDRVVVDSTTGEASLLTGAENGSPVPPALTTGSLPVAQIALSPGMTAITNVSITDERDLSGLAITAGGTLLNVRSFTANSTYTPTPGTTSVIVEAIGGGGSGGGSAATASGQMSAGGGGGAGAYARGRFTSGFAGVTVTVAAGVAAGAAGVSGQEGNSSSFGSLMTAPGGYGGQAGAAVSTPSITWGSNGSALPVGANIVSGSGEGGGTGIVLHTTSAAGGRGGATHFSAGSSGSLNGNPGSGNANFPSGAGGGGASNLADMPARPGGAGGAGLVIVYEYA